jgi:uncharacterized membrane protein YkoI
MRSPFSTEDPVVRRIHMLAITTAALTALSAASLVAQQAAPGAAKASPMAAAAAKPAAHTSPMAATTASAAKQDVKAPKITEDKPGLFKKAKITPEAATATALAKVPGGSVKKGELEEEDGALIYSFDITSPGKKGIDEVHVDAMTGAVVKTEHESAKEEKAEAKAEAKKPTPAKKP